MNVLGLLGPMSIPAARLRQEIFLLGGRHRGDALAGARRELSDGALTAERRRLLRAVERHLALGEGGSPQRDETSKARPASFGLVDVAALGAIVLLAMWLF